MLARRSVRLPDLDVELRSYPRGYEQPSHTHAWGVVNIVLSGTVEESSRHGKVRVGPLSVYSRPPGLLHANAYGEGPTRVLCIVLGAGWSALRWREPRRLIARSSLLGALVRALLGDRGGLDAVPREVRALVEEPEAARPRDRTRADLDRACELLAEPGAAVAEVAAALGRHPVSLARLVRRQHGASPTELRRWLRVERAAARIEAGEPLVDVALECGFADQSHMCRDFRKVLGTTPGEWRELLRHA